MRAGCWSSLRKRDEQTGSLLTVGPPAAPLDLPTASPRNTNIHQPSEALFNCNTPGVKRDERIFSPLLPPWDHCWNAWENNHERLWVWIMYIHAYVTPGTWLCVDQRHCGLREAESRLVYSGPDPPWTQIHILPGTVADPVLCYHDYTALLPEGEQTHQTVSRKKIKKIHMEKYLSAKNMTFTTTYNSSEQSLVSDLLYHFIQVSYIQATQRFTMRRKRLTWSHSSPLWGPPCHIEPICVPVENITLAYSLYKPCWS